MKVEYRALDGGTSVAYLDAVVSGGDQSVWGGFNKYTDEPVNVRWNGHEWLEVE